ncbi:MAG: NYN domain-containing protein [Myxococcota bacterium]
MENNLAVLIDFENIAAGTEKEGLGRFDVEALMMRVKDKGRILVARSYADWGRFSRFKQSLLTANVTMMELTSHGMQDKNRADIAMVVDALELAFTRDYIHTFVVVSGDSDFTPMVLKMRELNKRVIGIGTRKSTSRLLIQACDEFVFYDSVVQTKTRRSTRKESSEPKEISTAIDLLEQALDGLQRESPDQPLASVVKSAVLRKSPDFNETDLGFSSFARFLEAAQEAGVVRLSRDTKSGGYRVTAAEDDEEKATEEVEPAESQWHDSYLPASAEPYVDLLSRAHLDVLGAPIRMAVLEALVDVVSERAKKRRKTTLQFVREDVKKKLRRTHPDLPQSLLKAALDGLMQAGELIHRDGTAIRSGTAPFSLSKDAEGLNESLVRLYLGYLREKNVDLTDTSALAELMYGDADRRREIEETLAYLATAPSDDDLDLDLDDLLVPSRAASDDDDHTTNGVGEATEEPEEPEAEAAEAEEEAPKRKRTRRPAKKKDDEAAEAKADDEAEVKAEPKKAAAKAEPKKAAKAEPEAAEEEEAPKKRPRRRTTKKAEAEPEPEMSDLDALLEPLN